jgi:hypothetical protein
MDNIEIQDRLIHLVRKTENALKKLSYVEDELKDILIEVADLWEKNNNKKD